MPEPAALEVRGLSAWYGEAQALLDVSFSVGHGELVTLVGRNGAGKTTVLRCVMGLHTQCRGTVLSGDLDLTHRAPHERARAGTVFVPASPETGDSAGLDGVRSPLRTQND